MRRYSIVAVLVGLVIAVVAAAPAGAADDQPVGGCPGGESWNLVPVDEVIDRDVGIATDGNGDGWVCQRDNRGLDLDPDDPNYGGTWTVKDNTSQIPVGGCPSGTTNDGPDPSANGWSLEPIEAIWVGADVGSQVDQNGDGYVCQRFVYGFRLAPFQDPCCGYWTVKDNTTPVKDNTIP